MRLDFTLAKKFSRNNVKGLELRSASLDRAVLFNTSGKGYEKIRSALSENLQESLDIRVKGVGKSLEITGPDTMKALKRLNFVNESHNDFVDFYNREIGNIGEVVSLEVDEKAALVEMYSERESFENFFDELLPIIEKYDIGILKK